MSNKKQQVAFQGKECFSRMNFLFQASMLMAGSNKTLAAYYGELCKNIGKKAVLKIDPDVKRQLCKRCSLALRPGITADLETVSQGKRRKCSKNSQNMDENTSLQLTCQQCGFKRKYLVNPDYKFWLESKESVMETVTVGQEKVENKRKQPITQAKESQKLET